MEFKGFNKISRLNRNIVITEKIDGTNAQIVIVSLDKIKNYFAGDYQHQDAYVQDFLDEYLVSSKDGRYMFAGSRTRWLSSDKDNYGFYSWCKENIQELFKLGEGQHFGEWWGNGIQRKYILDEKRFSLFNTYRWARTGSELKQYPTQNPKIVKSQEYAPSCCYVVPVLYEGKFSEVEIDNTLEDLRKNGSKASEGFMNPEGIVIFHTASNQLFKVTLEKDDKPKGKL